jgi:hypothetical protein
VNFKMSFFDIKSIEYEPDLSSKFFRTYGIVGTQFVAIRVLVPAQSKITTQYATRRGVSNFVNALGRGGSLFPSIPFQAVFEQLPTHIQEELIYELDIFLEK